MILKSVELIGFKSFPEKTVIEFGSGITAIIGPNGSGKSNISDAVRWVLGEMSMKSLRGSRMEDVIFTGAAGLPPATFASVTLCLDTSAEHAAAQSSDGGGEKRSPVASIGDGEEISVTRKLYRTGESEYYINSKQVRLKDIYELFYDTGVGREGYSIIGQGKIDEVLSRRDEERRSIFEEAAGISKYRAKKNETERKLRDAEQNLLRIGDVLAEVKSRVGPLEKEAENARRYIELSGEKKSIEVTLWLDKLDSLRETLKKNEEHLAASQTRYDLLCESLSERENCLDAAINESNDLSAKYSDGEREAAELEREAERLRGGISVTEAEIRRLEELKVQSNESIKLALTQIDAIDAELGTAREELAAAEEKVQSLRLESETLQSRYAGEKHKILSAQEELAGAEAQERQASSVLAAAELEKAQLITRAQLAEHSLENAKQALTSLEAESNELGNAAAAAADLAENAAEKCRKCEAAREASVHEAADAAAIENRERATVSEKRVALSAVRQRHESLERMERLLEGYSDSVRTLLGAVKEFRLRCTVYGTVSSIINTTDEYVVAVETALGAGVQHIVVEDESDAKACIAFLKQNRAGRATFLPVTTIKGRRADVSAVQHKEGYLGLACDAVTTEARFEPIATDLLGRTVIARDIDCASVIARAAGFKIRVVTLDGQVINAGGSYTGGSAAKKTGIMTRSLDLERLAAQIKSEDEALLELELSLRKAEKKRIAADEAVDTATAALTSARADEAAAAAEKSAADRRLAEHEARVIQAAAVLENEKNVSAALEDNLKQLEERCAELKRQYELACEKTAGSRAAAETTDESERRALETLNASKLALSEAESAFGGCRYRVELLEKTRSGIAERKERDDDAIARADADIIRLNSERVETEKAAGLVAVSLEKKRAEQQELNAAISNKRIEVDGIRAGMREVSVEKEQAFVELTSARSMNEKSTSELETVSGRLWDEYELTYSDALPLRLPADKMDKAASRLASLKASIRALGTINVNAVEEYKTLRERYDFLTKQVGDLEKTRRSLDSTIEKLDSAMKESFLDSFTKINTAFGEVFTELFGGGTAYVSLTDPSDPLGCGIEIIVKPPGKTVRSISLLSGGEQSFAAMALYLALQRINPAPFCIFDEIESALDEVNVNRFASYVKAHSGVTQYILITHRRGTMECADTLYGVTMQRKGISEYLKVSLDSVKLEQR